MKKIDNLVAPKSVAHEKKNNQKGNVTIVSKQGSSRCVLIDKELADELELNDKVVIAFQPEEKKILLGKKIPGIQHEGYFLRERIAKNMCTKKVIYNSGLVQEIIDILQLDFSEKTSVTLYGLELVSEEEDIIAVVGKEK